MFQSSSAFNNQSIKSSKYTSNNLDEKTFDLIVKFKSIYPDIDISSLDDELLQNMIDNILNHNIINKSDEIIDKNLLMAHDLIPEMLIPYNLINLEGKINNVPIKIMIDTGASACFAYKSIIEKCNLEYLIDKSSCILAQGAHGINNSIGTIWFLDIELNISNDMHNFASIPITVNILDDTEIIKHNNKNIKHDNKNNIELVLGMNFLKSYKVNIDFSSRTLTLNNSIKIIFN